MNGRSTLDAGDPYHALLKLLVVARAVTIAALVEEMLCEGLRREFERDSSLAVVVRQLVLRDEQADSLIRERMLDLLNVLVKSEE